MRRKTGRRVLELLRRRGISIPSMNRVRDAHYFYKGTWYQQPAAFPCVYFDASGYVMFESESDFCRCGNLSIGVNVNILPHGAGISLIPGYRALEVCPSAL